MRQNLKRVTENDLEINQLSSKYERQSNPLSSRGKYLTPALSRPSAASSAKVTDRKERSSRQDIQDEQMRQIEERVRRQESGQFKKGNFRSTGNSHKEILPFNADFQQRSNGNKGRGLKGVSSTTTLKNRDVKNYNRGIRNNKEKSI